MHSFEHGLGDGAPYHESKDDQIWFCLPQNHGLYWGVGRKTFLLILLVGEGPKRKGLLLLLKVIIVIV